MFSTPATLWGMILGFQLISLIADVLKLRAYFRPIINLSTALTFMDGSFHTARSIERAEEDD